MAQDFDGFVDGSDSNGAAIRPVRSGPAVDAAIRDARLLAGCLDVVGDDRRIGMGGVDGKADFLVPKEGFHSRLIHPPFQDGHIGADGQQGRAVFRRHRNVSLYLETGGVTGQFPTFCRPAGNPHRADHSR